MCFEIVQSAAKRFETRILKQRYTLEITEFLLQVFHAILPCWLDLDGALSA